jgi:hypothetical protein
MLDLELSNDRNAITVEEVAVALLAVAGSNPASPSAPADLAIGTIEAWRKIWPACEAIAALYGVAMTQPVGWAAAHRIVLEAVPYLQAEVEATSV